METAKRLESLEFSKIRILSEKAEALRKEGREMHNFTLGQPDFPTPKYIVDACKKAMDDGYTTYPGYAGIPSYRKAVCDKYERENALKFDPSQVISTCGAAQAAYLVLTSFLNPGDEIIIPDPMYNIYENIATVCGAVIKKYALREENHFQINMDEFTELLTDKTKLVVTCSPSNPIGSILTVETLDALGRVLQDRDVLVVSDEIYERLVYDGEKAVSPATIPALRNKTIIINGFSKAFSMTGWRAGYVIAPPEFVPKLILHTGFQVSGITSFVQHACAAALNDEWKYHVVEEMRSEFEKRRNYMTREINSTKHFSCLVPKGAFYIFMNIKKTGMTSAEFVDWLLEEYGVAFVVGSVFGKEGEGFVRISYAASMDEIKKCCELLHKADAALNKKQ